MMRGGKAAHVACMCGSGLDFATDLTLLPLPSPIPSNADCLPPSQVHPLVMDGVLEILAGNS